MARPLEAHCERRQEFRSAERTKAEEAVDRALSRFALKSPTIRRLTKKVLRAQRALQKVVSKRAWLAYLHVEEAVGRRDMAVLDAAIRIALKPERR